MARRPPSSRRNKLALFSPLSIILLATPVLASTASTLPYDATTLLTLNDTVYLFQDRTFASLNTSTASDISDSPFTTVTDELPFGTDSSTSSYLPALANGSLTVYAGDCKKGNGALWLYDLSSKSWVRKTVNNGTDDAPGMLGAAIGFTSTIDPTSDSAPSIYSFGGMCGTPSSNVWAWQSAADYTGTMTRLSAESTDNDAIYNASTLSLGTDTPVSAAGFTWTGTTPAVANKAASTTQQQDYVMIGGHTSSAFVNMSEVAVWRLPEEEWSFIEVSNSGSVSSRSGHSAVLSEDGDTIVVMGGWVGKVTEAADPQLVLLKMSDSDDGWAWEVPENQPSGNGTYGHGAAVLPGNVVMMYGGYDVGYPSSSSKRDVSGSAQYYNLTSGEWSTSYSNPSAVSTTTATSTSATSTATSTTTSTSSATKSGNSSRNLILGLAIGLGVPLVLLLIAALCILCRRHRDKKSRDNQIRALAQDEAHFLPSDGQMTQRNPSGSGWLQRPSAYTVLPATQDSAYESIRGQGDDAGQAGERSAGDSRGKYAAPGGSPTSPIDPIYEREETAYDPHSGDLGHRPTPVALTDVHRPPPENDYEEDQSPRRLTRDPDVDNWMNSVDQTDRLISGLSRHNTTGCAEIRNALAAVQGRPVSKESDNSFGTAKSNFVALRNEGPSLLMGGMRGGRSDESDTRSPNFPSESRYDEPDDEEFDQPPSPSKYRGRNSWLGSLKRVFSNKTSTSEDNIPPPRDSTGAELFTATDFNDTRPGALGTSSLLRRKQGRQAWEDMPEHLRNGDGDSSEWDIERAVEQRLVQVMFTVPKERLRVVNAEIEREEEVMIVDPSIEEGVSLVSYAGDISGASAEAEEGTMADQSRGRSGSLRVAKLRGGSSRETLTKKATKSYGELRRQASDLSSHFDLGSPERTLHKKRSRVGQMVDRFEGISRESSPVNSLRGRPAGL